MRGIIVAITLSLLLGCAKETAGISIKSSNQQVILANAELAEHLEFGSAVTENVNERLLAQITVTNKSKETQSLQYRFDWYDKQGLEVNLAATPWQPLLVYGSETITLQGVAVSPAATNFRLTIRSLTK